MAHMTFTLTEAQWDAVVKAAGTLNGLVACGSMHGAENLVKEAQQELEAALEGVQRNIVYGAAK